MLTYQIMFLDEIRRPIEKWYMWVVTVPRLARSTKLCGWLVSSVFSPQIGCCTFSCACQRYFLNCNGNLKVFLSFSHLTTLLTIFWSTFTKDVLLEAVGQDEVPYKHKNKQNPQTKMVRHIKHFPWQRPSNFYPPINRLILFIVMGRTLVETETELCLSVLSENTVKFSFWLEYLITCSYSTDKTH